MFTVDNFWDLLTAASGDTVDGLTDVLDSLAKDSKAKGQIYFDTVLSGAPPSQEPDWIRLKNFLLDWYSAHQTIASASSKITDPRTLTNSDLDELFRSFGYNYSTQLKGPDENPIDLKINFFLDLVNLYKRKGTPQAIFEVLQYYGVTKLDIYEFFIKLQSEESLIFEGSAVAGTSTNPSKLVFDYDRLASNDPHWLYTEQQILDLQQINDINLPSKTPYLGVRPVASIDGSEIGILIRLVQDQFQYYLDHGTPPTSNAEISEIGEVVSLLELYLSIVYVFNKQYNVGQVGDNFLCYDGTNNNITTIIDEFDIITAKPTNRAGILTGLESFYDGFTREMPRNFLQNKADAGIFLQVINPSLKSALDSSTLSNPDLLFNLMKDLSSWVRINLGYGFVNMGFIMFGLDSFFSELKPVMDFFKPYRARLLLLELLEISNPLFNSVIVEDLWEGLIIQTIEHDFVTGNGHPCCTELDFDSTDSYNVCLNDSTTNLYYQRETFDCGSYFDVGAVTDLLQTDFFPFIEEIRRIPLICVPPDFDSTAIVMNELIYDSTSADANGILHTELTTGGFANFDESGNFDCPTGFDEVWIQVYEESSSSSSVSSSSVSSSSSSQSIFCEGSCTDTFSIDSTSLNDSFWTENINSYTVESGYATMKILSGWQIVGDIYTAVSFSSDFDVRLDFTIENVNNDGSGTTGGWLNLWPVEGSGYFGLWIGNQQSGGTLNGFQYWSYDGDYDWVDTTSVETLTGSLRITRYSGVVKGYYWQDGIWQYDGNPAGVTIETGFTTTTQIEVETYLSIQSGDALSYSPIMKFNKFCTVEGCP